MLDAATRRAAQRHRAPARPRRDLHPARRPQSRDSRLAPAVFLALETSPGNFQAWVAMPGAEDKEFARRLKKGTGADTTASGATRVAGSLNFKDKYAPEFPRVAIHAGAAGPSDERGRARAARAGRGAGSRRAAAVAPCPLTTRGSNRKWPSYARCARRRAAQQRRHRPRHQPGGFRVVHDRDHMGLGVDETAERLMEESTKARANGEELCRTDRAQCRARRGAPPADRTTADGGTRARLTCYRATVLPDDNATELAT